MRHSGHILLLAAVLLLSACTKEQNLYCTLTLEAHLPGGENIVSMVVDNTLPGNKFRNINNGIAYPFPVFVNNSCTLRIQKGVYQIAFDGEVTLADGTVKYVRFSAYSALADAIELMEDTKNLPVELVVMR